MVPATVDDKIADALHPPPPPGARTGPHAIDDKLGTTNQNPWGMTLWDLLKEDFRTHDRELFSQGFWAVALHRFGNWRMDVKHRALRVPFSLLYKFLYKVVEWTCGISLNYPVKLGRRVRIWHHSGMILGARSIGNDVHIRQNTTFGVARRGDHRSQKPIIEDRVDIGAGVVIAGAITIGHDSVIGANAVVLKDVPPYSLAVGVPAKVIKTFDPTARIAAAIATPPPQPQPQQQPGSDSHPPQPEARASALAADLSPSASEQKRPLITPPPPEPTAATTVAQGSAATSATGAA